MIVFVLLGTFILVVIVAAVWGRIILRRQMTRVGTIRRSGIPDRPPTSITLERDGSIYFVRPLAVFIDGKKVGDVAPEEVRHFPVSVGKHIVQVRLDWARSTKIAVDVTPGIPCRLQCGTTKLLERYNAPVMSLLLFHSSKILYLQTISHAGASKVSDGADLIPLTIGFANFSGDDLAGLLTADLEVLSPIFKNVNVAPAHRVPSCDVLFVYAHLLDDGALKWSPNPVEFMRIAQGVGAKIAVLASSNPSERVQKTLTHIDQKSANLIVTLDRNGDGFGIFFRQLFEKMRLGVPMLAAWSELAPQHPNLLPDRAPATLCLFAAGNLAFPVCTQ